MYREQGAPGAATPTAEIEFDGYWGDFLAIAGVNLMLSIVTIGFYRFWGKTKVRQYLWSRTTILGERLEYTGTGMELFVGAIIAFFLLMLPLGVLSNVAQGLLLGKQFWAAGLVYVGMIVGLFYLVGVGLYRTQRYMLSRTHWRGIRGGMTEGGWAYGLSYMWRNLVAMVALFLASPWAAVRLWNALWNDARFGSLAFRAEATARPLFLRFLLTLAAIVAVSAIIIGANAALFVKFAAVLKKPAPGQIPDVATMMMVVAAVYALIFGLFVAIWLISLGYQALYWRHVIGHLSLDGLRLRFTATVWDWLRFALVNLGLLAITLGLGFIMMPYRKYAFMLRHLKADGTLMPEAMQQSRLAMPTQGEGIGDAFDISPF